MSIHPTTRPTGLISALGLALRHRTRILAGLSLSSRIPDRDLERVGAELMAAAQDEGRPEKAASPDAVPARARHLAPVATLLPH